MRVPVTSAAAHIPTRFRLTDVSADHIATPVAPFVTASPPSLHSPRFDSRCMKPTSFFYQGGQAQEAVP